jgi:4-alpha-glucanotransferase
MLEDGLIDAGDLPPGDLLSPERADYRSAAKLRDRLFSVAHSRFRSRRPPPDFEAFCREHAHWLEDFVLFTALRNRYGGRPWPSWPPGLRDRDPEALDAAGKELEEEMDRMRFVQYLLHGQWRALRSYCRDRGIELIGDMPIYVVLDSADVWVAPHCFKLDEKKRPTAVAGVPPDYFSETGQLWGNPVYRWDVLKERGYDWWIRRIRHNLALYDRVRVDHFRGFVGYWEVPAGEETAINGRWVDAPAVDFFESVLRRLPAASIIAEDLGVITPDVREVMERFGFPGMKVLVFAFGPGVSSNPYAPHNHEKHCLVYTGTHDNNTVRGWFEQETTGEDRARLASYVGHKVRPETVHLDLMRMALASVGDTAVLSMPDVLGLDGRHRMNTPSTSEGNWTWRMLPGAASESLARGLRKMSELYGRVKT